MIGIIRKIFQPRLAEHIPGQKRIYKNMFGKTIRTIKLTEESIKGIDKDKALQSMKAVTESDLYPDTKKAVNIIEKLATTGKPIDATSFIVEDKNGFIERIRSTLKSGEAVVRYKTSFQNGDFSTADISIKSNF